MESDLNDWACQFRVPVQERSEWSPGYQGLGVLPMSFYWTRIIISMDEIPLLRQKDEHL